MFGDHYFKAMLNPKFECFLVSYRSKTLNFPCSILFSYYFIFSPSFVVQVGGRSHLAPLPWFLLLVDACFEHVKCTLLLPFLFRWEKDFAWLLSLGFFYSWTCVLTMLNAFFCFHYCLGERNILLGSFHLVFLVHGCVF